MDLMFYVVEKTPLVKEPPPDEICEDRFLVEVTPVTAEQDDIGVSVSNFVGAFNFYSYFLNRQVDFLFY